MRDQRQRKVAHLVKVVAEREEPQPAGSVPAAVPWTMDREAALDEALAQTFPASDPIACTPKSFAELKVLGRSST